MSPEYMAADEEVYFCFDFILDAVSELLTNYFLRLRLRGDHRKNESYCSNEFTRETDKECSWL